MPALAIHNKIFIPACIVISVNRGEILFGQEIGIKGLNVRSNSEKRGRGREGERE